MNTDDRHFTTFKDENTLLFLFTQSMSAYMQILEYLSEK